MRGAAEMGREDPPERLAALNVLRACAATLGSDGAHGVILEAAGVFVAAPALSLVSGLRGHSSDARSATSLCGETFCGDGFPWERSSSSRRSSALSRSSMLPHLPRASALRSACTGTEPAAPPAPADSLRPAIAFPCIADPVTGSSEQRRLGWDVAGLVDFFTVAPPPSLPEPARGAFVDLSSPSGRRCVAFTPDMSRRRSTAGLCHSNFLYQDSSGATVSIQLLI